MSFQHAKHPQALGKDIHKTQPVKERADGALASMHDPFSPPPLPPFVSDAAQKKPSLLSDDDRRRIYEEERVRLEAKRALNRESCLSQLLSILTLICLPVIGYVLWGNGALLVGLVIGIANVFMKRFASDPNPASSSRPLLGSATVLFSVLCAALMVGILNDIPFYHFYNSNSSRSFDNENCAVLFGNPDSYRGASVTIVGKIFGRPMKSGDGTQWQMWADPKNNGWNTAVYLDDDNTSFDDGDFVRVYGRVRGSLRGTNAFGATIQAVVIDAYLATKVDAEAANSPSVFTQDFNEGLRQHGLAVFVDKIDFADDETRVYVTVRNGSGDRAYFHTLGAKARQGSRQFDSQYSTHHTTIPSEILAGVKASGSIVFPPMARGRTVVELDARTNDYSRDFVPYVFDLDVRPPQIPKKVESPPRKKTDSVQKEKAPTEEPEAIAERKLNLAKGLLEANPYAAMSRLKEIVAQYPKTKAADKARTMLKRFD